MRRKQELIAVDFTPFAISGGRRDVGPEETGGLVANIFKKKYRELFAVLDATDFAKRLLAWVRLYGPQNGELSMDDQLAWAETATLELLRRGAVKLIIETPEAAADIEKLGAAVAKSNLRPQPAAITAVEDQSVTPAPDPIDECAADFKTLASSEFRAKWMTRSNRPVFDEAVLRGLV